MVNVVNKAIELGYLHLPDGIMIDIDAVSRYPQEKVIVVTTGSQGEPMSALSRMAASDHRKISVTPQDFIIISATPIPGNEKHVNRVVNELMRLGSEAVSYTHLDVYKRQVFTAVFFKMAIFVILYHNFCFQVWKRRKKSHRFSSYKCSFTVNTTKDVYKRQKELFSKG